MHGHFKDFVYRMKAYLKLRKVERETIAPVNF